MASILSYNSLDTLRFKEPENLMQTRVRVQIPKARHPDPVLSNLINRYYPKVNILGALLGTNGKEDG